MCNNNEEQSMDRTLLREARRLRRKEKREVKRSEKEKEREKKSLAIKCGPKDSHVTIITREMANLRVIDNFKTIGNNYIEMKETDFPLLGQKFSPKNHFKSSSCDTQMYLSKDSASVPNDKNDKHTSTKRNKSSLIKVDIMDAIVKPIKNNLKSDKVYQVKQYEGNMLDSSQPERKKGKHREVPKTKMPSKLKMSILKESQSEELIKPVYSGIHNSLFEIYCDNCVTKELNEATSNLLSEIVNFQEKLYKRDPIKGVSKRRYVVGFHEIKKYLKIDKLKIIIIAPNIKIITKDGVLENTVSDIKNLANGIEVPYIFALSRRIIGRITLKYHPVSCVGILDYSGAEQHMKNVTELLSVTREQYKKNMSMDVNSENERNEISQLTEKMIISLK